MWRMKERFWLTVVNLCSKVAAKAAGWALAARLLANDAVPPEERTRRFNKMLDALGWDDGPDHIQ